MSSRNGLIIFIRNPELGKVKTRLAREIGDESALEIYKALLDYTQQVSLEVDTRRFLFYYQHIVDDNWDSDHFDKYLQIGSDLGKNMSHAFATALEVCDKVLIIGSDCPKITKTIIDDAYAALDHHDVTIGPTYDGGYYLLGMNNFYPNLFTEIEYSTPDVYEQTLSKIKTSKFTVAVMPILSDVDYKEDWEKYGWELK